MRQTSYFTVLFQIKESKRKSYPIKVPIPPTKEEFENSVASNFEATEISIEDQFKQRKELKKFMSLYKKSALFSSNRKAHLQNNDFENEYSNQDSEDYNDENMTVNNFEEEWQEMADSEDNMDSPECLNSNLLPKKPKK